MQVIDKQEFGVFLVEMRKEKGMTQKQLAEQLYVSDKAVSKWERGLSLPDISLLIPLSQIFEISITELLQGTRLDKDEIIPVEHSNILLEKIIFMKNKGFVITDCLIQKEKINMTYKKISLFISLSFLSTLAVIFFVYGTLIQKISFQNIEILGPVVLLSSDLLILLNFFLFFRFLYFTYRKSIGYLIFSPIYLISNICLLNLIWYLKELSNFEIATIILQYLFITYLVIVIMSLILMIYSFYRYKNKLNL